MKMSLKNKKLITIASVLIILIVTVSLLLIGYLLKTDKKTPATQPVVVSFNQANYVDVAMDSSSDYSFMVNNQWTNLGSNVYPRLVNYKKDVVEAELKADGRYPANVSWYDDISDRSLKSYPYSLDGMYEIFVEWGNLNDLQLDLNSYVEKEYGKGSKREREGRKIEDLSVYRLNDREIADFILSESGEDGLKAARVIVYIDHENVAKFTINTSNSRNRITKHNFDGLMEMVSSVKFAE